MDRRSEVLEPGRENIIKDEVRCIVVEYEGQHFRVDVRRELVVEVIGLILLLDRVPCPLHSSTAASC